MKSCFLSPNCKALKLYLQNVALVYKQRFIKNKKPRSTERG